MAIFQKGHQHSNEIKRKISLKLKGNIPWNKGKKGSQTAWNKGKTGCYSEEMIKKMSLSHKGKTTWNKGKTGIYSEKTRQKMGHRGEEHPLFGKHHSEETKRKIAFTKINEKNPVWKGDNAGYAAIHAYIKRRFQKPDFCKSCKKETSKLDLSNNSKQHKRDLSDWEWLCRRCHMIKDGHYKNMKQYRGNTYSFIKEASK